MNFKWLVGIGILCSAIVTGCTFLYFPMMGHDYNLVLPLLIDLDVAWTKYGVLNPHYSPIKCMGTPLWANPLSFNLSILHILTLLTNPTLALISFIFLTSLFSFWGAYKLSGRLGATPAWSLYLAAGWTLQGWMIMRSAVGHTMYLFVGLFPLIVFLLLDQGSKRKNLISILSLVFIFVNFVLLSTVYAPLFFIMSLISLIPIYLHWRDKFLILNLKAMILKVSIAGAVSLLLILPKLLGIFDLMNSYPRLVKLYFAGFPTIYYSVINLLSFLPHNYKALTGWFYGNWESVQYIFPLYLVLCLGIFIIRRQKDYLEKTLFPVFYLVIISFVLSSGLLADIFSVLPLFKSMHVNPRWNSIILLPLFFLCVFISTCLGTVRKSVQVILWILVLSVPFFHLDRDNLSMGYRWRIGYSEEVNRMSYCYEPFLGYRLENFPYAKVLSEKYGPNDLLDPRCYLKSKNCTPGTKLSEKDRELLESYRLE